MRQIILFAFFVILAAIIFKCTSGSLNIVELNLNPQKDAVIAIMPLADAKNRLATKSPKWRGKLTNVIARETGLFTPFDEKDYLNLRQLLIRSLRKSQAFKAVHDIQTETTAESGIRVYIRFDESGKTQSSLASFCDLNAFAWIETAADSVLSKKELQTKGRSNWSTGGAKNKAISKFIKEVAQFISNVQY